MGNVAVAEELTGTDELEELYELDASESHPEDDDEEEEEDDDDDDDEEEDDDEEDKEPDEIPHG
jgi:hypothetical protein